MIRHSCGSPSHNDVSWVHTMSSTETMLRDGFFFFVGGPWTYSTFKTSNWKISTGVNFVLCKCCEWGKHNLIVKHCNWSFVNALESSEIQVCIWVGWPYYRKYIYALCLAIVLLIWFSYKCFLNSRPYSSIAFFFFEHSALLIKQHQYKGFAGCNPEQSKKLD
jgi:hypothetical protein